MFTNNFKNFALVRNLRANGDKVIHFLHFGEDYILQTSAEMRAVAAICEPSQKLVLAIPASKLDYYIHQLINNDFKIVVG